MELKELKNDILNNTLSNQFLVLLCEDNYFLADQYLNKLSEVRHEDITYISSLSDTLTATAQLLLDYDNNIKVLRVDTFDELYDDYSQFFNCIILCKKIDKTINDKVAEYIVKVSAPTDWQVKDYILTKCPGLDKASIEWLYNTLGIDLYKLTMELDKLALFPTNDQLRVLSALRFSPGSDLYNKTILQLSNDISSFNKVSTLDYLIHSNVCDFEPLILVSLLLNTFKKMYLVKYQNIATYKEIGISENQYRYLLNQSNYTESFLTAAISFLADIDFRLKSGRLELTKDKLLDYIIVRIFSLK